MSEKKLSDIHIRNDPDTERNLRFLTGHLGQSRTDVIKLALAKLSLLESLSNENTTYSIKWVAREDGA